ncbi:MAG: ROK family protein [Flexilinea sp.]
MNQNGKYALALDFGGTKLATAVVRIGDGELSGYQKVTTPAAMGADACLGLIMRTAEQSLIKSAIPLEKIKGAGISFGGLVSADGSLVLKSMHVEGWNNYPLPKYVSDYFHLPVRMGNDGNVAALGEWHYGSHAKPDHFMYIQISTGIGGGFILNRELYLGQGMGAEVGHQKVQFDETSAYPCACGSKGCIEAVASGWALARDAKKLSEQSKIGSIFDRAVKETGECSAKTLVYAARMGDPDAVLRVKTAFKSFALTLSNAITLLDFEEIVIGGGVAVNSWDFLEPILNEKVPEFLSTNLRGRTTIRLSKLKGTETLLGAAKLIDD